MKFMSIYPWKVFIHFLFLALLFSCKKDKNEPEETYAFSGAGVFVSGYLLDETRNNRPVVWKNGKPIFLMEEGFAETPMALLDIKARPIL